MPIFGSLTRKFHAFTARPYELVPLEGVFGAEIKGITLKDLRADENEDMINHLKKDFDKYKLLIVRDQVGESSLVLILFTRNFIT